MQRIQTLLRPAPQPVNWKAALAMLGVAAACLSIYAQATAADKTATNATGKSDRPAVVDFNTCAKPAWPEGAIAANRTGAVRLAFQIGKDGKVKGSRINKSSGHPDLDQAAREGIQKCAFKPAVKNGKTVETWQQMMYVWTLE